MSSFQENPAEFINALMSVVAHNATSSLHHAAITGAFSCPVPWQDGFRSAMHRCTAFDFGNVDLMSCAHEQVDLTNPACPTLLEFWRGQRAEGHPLIAITERGELPLAMLMSKGPTPGSVRLLHLNEFTKFDCATWRAFPVEVVVYASGSTATASSDSTWNSDAELAEASEQVLARTAGFEGLLSYWRKSPFATMSKTFLDWGAGQRPAMMFELRAPG